MGVTLTIVIAVVVAFIVYVLVHRLIVRRTTHQAQEEALNQTNVAVKASLQRLVDDRFITKPAEFVTSTINPDGWGRGVMAFEYVIILDHVTDAQLPILRQRLNHILAEFTQDYHIASAEGDQQSAFLITDIWRHETRIHMSIAYLVNEATVEYLQDLHRLERPDATTDTSKNG
ncbi:hypothetical protein [Secundilactobacillus collinoides]|uniref:Uncharacterized protein n=1 Tax=Secundilactobacillus collinoides DSM 20515 = JCM 1123 TaxID=1423733 RepID=A0A0R2B900_SECCO|nr:hypothetical protein [Secundilactobacillus collinoides]KRM75768.1 hypothetical protein FC82_GL002173 [Secundilactobacillus collinoides DSM 20515 = JCM 1123]